MRHLEPLIDSNTESELKGWLHDSWFVPAANVPRRGIMQADGRVGIVLSACRHGSRLHLSPLGPDSHEVRARAVVLGPECWLLGVRFEPGAFRSLFNLSYRSFVSGRTTESLQGWEERLRFLLHELAEEHTSWGNCTAEVRAATAPLRKAPDERWSRIGGAVAALKAPSGATDLNNLARSSGFSRRQFERVFADHVGMSPKVFRRTQRLGHARQLLRDGMSPASAAQRVGCADQAHLTREFKVLLGLTPSKYQRRSPPATR